MTDLYASWDAALAAGHMTDDPDGWPDRRIVPLVERLRCGGVLTLQSCAGHPGHSDGHLWIAGHPAWVFDPAPFTYVKATIHPEARTELGWLPEHREPAYAAIEAAWRRSIRTGKGGQEPPLPHTYASMIGAAAALFDVDVEKILPGSHRRQDRQTAKARQSACWLLRQRGMSQPEIGRVLGVDHTTVLHACRVVDRDPSRRALLRLLLGDQSVRRAS